MFIGEAKVTVFLFINIYVVLFLLSIFTYFVSAMLGISSDSHLLKSISHLSRRVSFGMVLIATVTMFVYVVIEILFL